MSLNKDSKLALFNTKNSHKHDKKAKANKIYVICILILKPYVYTVIFHILKRRGQDSGGPQGDSLLTDFLSVGVTLCLPPWSQN